MKIWVADKFCIFFLGFIGCANGIALRTERLFRDIWDQRQIYKTDFLIQIFVLFIFSTRNLGTFLKKLSTPNFVQSSENFSFLKYLAIILHFKVIFIKCITNWIFILLEYRCSTKDRDFAWFFRFWGFLYDF
jgi:hypothetical protein